MPAQEPGCGGYPGLGEGIWAFAAGMRDGSLGRMRLATRAEAEMFGIAAFFAGLWLEGQVRQRTRSGMSVAGALAAVDEHIAAQRALAVAEEAA